MKKITKGFITATLSLGLLLNTGSLAFAGDRGAPDRPAMITLKKIQKETAKLNVKQKQVYYDNRVNGIVKEAKKEKSGVGQIKVIHDRLAGRIMYDYATADKTKGATKESYTKRGAIVNGQGVSQAYAEVFRDALTRAGITNKLLSNDKKNHYWNLVKVDGNFYHIDLTWDDDNTADIELPFYKWFLVNDKQIQKDHNYKPTSKTKATSTKYHAFSDIPWTNLTSDKKGVSYMHHGKGIFHVNLSGKVTLLQKFSGTTHWSINTKDALYFYDTTGTKTNSKMILSQVPKADLKKKKILFESNHDFTYKVYDKYIEVEAFNGSDKKGNIIYKKIKINL